MQRCRLFARDRSGAAALIFGLALIPVVGLLGAGMDYARMADARGVLQDASDAAALAIAASDLTNRQERIALGRTIFNSNIGPLASAVQRLIIDPDGPVTVDATGEIPTTLLGVMGFRNVTFNVHSAADASAPEGAEIVLVLDATNSMDFNNNFRRAIDELERLLEELRAYNCSCQFFVTLVPMSDRINIGTQYGHFIAGGAPAGWNGCLEPREETVGSFPLHAD